MDIMALIGGDTPLRKTASTHGGEWCGPCPFCGGRDRFRVQPVRGRWWCRRCSPDDRWEDAIAYLQRRDGVTFPQAREALGCLDAHLPQQKAFQRPLPPCARPSPAWQSSASRVAMLCEQQLWTSRGERARAWLRARGLTDETLRRWAIGYTWGQSIEDLWVPRGIVLPWWVEDRLWHLKVRRPVKEGEHPKYVAVKGGRPYLFGRDHLIGHETLVLTEGEFDAMLLWQEGRHLVDVATLGSCSSVPSEPVLWDLIPYRRIMVAYDMDRSGEEGALKLRALSARMKRIRVPSGDLTDFHRAKGSLADWLHFHLTDPA